MRHQSNPIAARLTHLAAVATMFIGLSAGVPASAQLNKVSEADLRQEIEGKGYPLTIHRAPAGHKIADRYIVMFTRDVTDPERETADIVEGHGGRVHYQYSHALHGFAATLSADAVEKLRHDQRIALIEEDRIAHATALPMPSSPQAPAPSWALDRIDQRGPMLDNSFSFPASGGQGVDIYIIDTGILGGINGQNGLGSHIELDGRVGSGADFITPSLNGDDCAGHGTFVASLAGGTTYGVAKLATIHPVRVMDCGEGGSSSSVIAGVNWVTADHLAHPGQRAVANMSLTMNGIDVAVDQAVQNSISSGIVYTIAAGNSAGRFDLITGADLGDSCNLSPQRVGAALTVGAMDDTAFSIGAFDLIASFSDIGGCVDLYAPGVLMTSASFRSTTSYTGPPFDGLRHIGTSYSAPMTAGVAALYYAAHPSASASQVASAVVANATLNALTFRDVVSGPNKLLYSDFQTDLQTTVSSNNGSPAAGAQFAYTFQIKNSGPYNTMDSVRFTDNLPAGLTGVGVVFSRGTCSGLSQITCDLGRLAVGEQATITVSVTAPFTPQSFTNTGTAILQSGQTDKAPANNAASLTLSSH